MLKGSPIRLNQTTNSLEYMFEIWQPEMWFYGHWHFPFKCNVRGTKFRCLDIFEKIEIHI